MFYCGGHVYLYYKNNIICLKMITYSYNIKKKNKLQYNYGKNKIIKK